MPRALAIPALYATMGFLAIIGALRRRPAIVVAAGVLCIAGMILSVATIGFAAPGLLLILLGSRIEALPTRHGSEAVSAAAAVLLVVSAAIALLVMTEGRCWQATGSPADPTYTVIPCGGQGVLVGGGQTFASGFDSGVLTTGGGLVEAVLLLGAHPGRRDRSNTHQHGRPAFDRSGAAALSAASPVSEGQAGPGKQPPGRSVASSVAQRRVVHDHAIVSSVGGLGALVVGPKPSCPTSDAGRRPPGVQRLARVGGG